MGFGNVDSILNLFPMGVVRPSFKGHEP